MIRPGQATQKCGLNLLHHVRIARTERQKFMAVALLFGRLQIPPCMEFYASLHIADTTCRYLYELFIHGTSAMNQASDSSRTKNKAHPFRSLQTITQKIHVPNDAIASHQSVRLLLRKSQPSWESSKCWRYLCTPIFPEFNIQSSTAAQSFIGKPMFSIWQSRHGPADFEEYLQDSVSMHPVHPTRSVASSQQSGLGYIKKSSKRPGKQIINACFRALIFRKHTNWASWGKWFEHIWTKLTHPGCGS